jgi:hypothetical protein
MYLTPRQPIGVWRGGGGSHRESSLLSTGFLGVIYDSQPHGYTHFFIAIRIRINFEKFYDDSKIVTNYLQGVTITLHFDTI